MVCADCSRLIHTRVFIQLFSSGIGCLYGYGRTNAQIHICKYTRAYACTYDEVCTLCVRLSRIHSVFLVLLGYHQWPSGKYGYIIKLSS